MFSNYVRFAALFALAIAGLVSTVSGQTTIEKPSARLIDEFRTAGSNCEDGLPEWITFS